MHESWHILGFRWSAEDDSGNIALEVSSCETVVDVVG